MNAALQTSSATQPDGFPFGLSVPSFSGELRVLAFQGLEAMSHPFRFDVSVGVSDRDVGEPMSGVLGQRASLLFEVPGHAVRTQCGIIVAVHAKHRVVLEGQLHRLRLVPRLWLLGRRKTSRIFQNQTVQEIVSAVLGPAVPHRWELESKYEPRTYCVQYQETDLAFVSRLLAEEGIFYFFEHGSEETVVLADCVRAYRPIPGDPRLIHHRGEAGSVHWENHVIGFEPRRCVRPGAVLQRDYDFRRPLLDLRAEVKPRPTAAHADDDPIALEADDLRVYDHHGQDDRPDVDERTARVRWEQQRTTARLAVGSTICRRMEPGRVFELAEHPTEALNRKYVVARVEHHGRGRQVSRGRRRTYSTTFACMPADVALRPRRTRRLQQVMETAVVVGPEGEEIFTDEYGRVKVQFPWDLQGKKNEHSSCWVRVAQTWAGVGWGSQFVPRVGMEVVVTFLGGDADRPLITGCVANTVNPVPFALPKNKTRSGILTRSSPGGKGANELSFEDKSGAEEVRIVAQRNLVEEVKHDRSAEIGHDDSLSVAGTRKINVNGSQLVSVRGMLAEQVDGTKRSTLGAVSDTVTGDHDVFVGHNRDVMVKGSERRTVLGDTVETFAGLHVVRAEMQHMLVIGSATVEGSAAVQSTGTYVVNADKSIRLVGGQALTLQCGDSYIELTAAGVTISAKTIHLKGTDSVVCEGQGPALRLTDHAELTADSLKMYSKAGSLELDDKTTKIIGPKVQINPDLTKPTPKDGDDKPETVPFSLQLTDDEFKPYAGKTYELTVEDLRFKGQTDGDGWVKHDVPKEARLASIDLWLDTYPTGRKHTYPVRLRDLDPPTEVSGAQTRLKNLGYYAGPGGSTAVDTETAKALQWFQRDHGIPVTGQLDAATVAALAKRYGH